MYKSYCKLLIGRLCPAVSNKRKQCHLPAAFVSGRRLPVRLKFWSGRIYEAFNTEVCFFIFSGKNGVNFFWANLFTAFRILRCIFKYIWNFIAVLTGRARKCTWFLGLLQEHAWSLYCNSTVAIARRIIGYTLPSCCRTVSDLWSFENSIYRRQTARVRKVNMSHFA